jgi:hypothetical protein
MILCGIKPGSVEPHAREAANDRFGLWRCCSQLVLTPSARFRTRFPDILERLFIEPWPVFYENLGCYVDRQDIRIPIM